MKDLFTEPERPMTGLVHHATRADLNAHIERNAESVFESHAQMIADMPDNKTRKTWMARLAKKHPPELLAKLRELAMGKMRMVA